MDVPEVIKKGTVDVPEVIRNDEILDGANLSELDWSYFLVLFKISEEIENASAYYNISFRF